jgi:peptidoglycan/xylan/chitin deacetylase (PgdA/CDA1 family)
VRAAIPTKGVSGSRSGKSIGKDQMLSTWPATRQNPRARPGRRATGAVAVLLLSVAIVVTGCVPAKAPSAGNQPSASAGAWSRLPPAGLSPAQVPQFVAITSDDNFGNEEPESIGGLKQYVEFMRPLRNADSTPVRGTFFHTTLYLEGNLTYWRAAFADGHEAGDHTVDHRNGGLPGIPGMSRDPCCAPSNFDDAGWRAEIGGARDSLTGKDGIGAAPGDIAGYRAPYLAYTDRMFSVLSELGFRYDTSIPNCFGDGENGTNCSWPYRLDAASPDTAAMAAKYRWAPIGPHKGLWELAPTTLVVPDDSHSARYDFRPGLRARIAAAQKRQGVLPYPTVYDAPTGRISGLDFSLLKDVKVTPDELLAIYKYNLDLHLSGNRAPLVVLSHSFLYAYEEGNEENTDSVETMQARWSAFSAFIEYANSKPQVRLRPMKDILAWMSNPTPIR